METIKALSNDKMNNTVKTIKKIAKCTTAAIGYGSVTMLNSCVCIFGSATLSYCVGLSLGKSEKQIRAIAMCSGLLASVVSGITMYCPGDDAIRKVISDWLNEE